MKGRIVSESSELIETPVMVTHTHTMVTHIDTHTHTTVIEAHCHGV